MHARIAAVVAGLALLSLSAGSALGQGAKTGVAGAGSLVVKALTERKVSALPPAPLFWRIDGFPSLEAAQAAAGPLGLVAQAGGKVYLFTLGPAGGSSSGGTKVAEIGPLAPIAASQYLLRVNEASGPPGSVTPVHSHPGAEAAYVLAGEQTFRTRDGAHRIGAGQSSAGHPPDTPMQVSSTGAVDLHALVMFVVDAGRPFSTRATLP